MAAFARGAAISLYMDDDTTPAVPALHAKRGVLRAFLIDEQLFKLVRVAPFHSKRYGLKQLWIYQAACADCGQSFEAGKLYSNRLSDITRRCRSCVAVGKRTQVVDIHMQKNLHDAALLAMSAPMVSRLHTVPRTHNPYEDTQQANGTDNGNSGVGKLRD
jgi:hypothetical protein